MSMNNTLSNKDVSDAIEELSKAIIEGIESAEPTTEEIEFANAKTDEERKAVYLKYHGDFVCEGLIADKNTNL